MNRPQGPDATALGQSPHQALQRMKQRENRLESSLDASRYAQEQGMADLARAQNAEGNTANHRFATELHRQAADQVAMAGPSRDPRVLQALSGFKAAAMGNLGIGSAANRLAEAGAQAAGGMLAV